MRPWLELRAAFGEEDRLRQLSDVELLNVVRAGNDLLPCDTAEHWAVCLACLLLGQHGPVMVPKSWGRSSLHPAACVVAASALGRAGLTWTGRVLMEPFGIPASCEVAGEIFLATFDAGLLRPASPALWKASGNTETRIEAVVHPGPRLLASIGEERERWETIW